MLLAILNCCTREELEESTDEDSEEDLAVGDHVDEGKMLRREAIKNKVLAVGRMARVFDLLRSVRFSVICRVFNHIYGRLQRRGRKCF
jgi:serine/threonine-protein phosphatase 2B catalytic subunit